MTDRMSTVGACPDPEAIAAFLAGRVKTREREALAAHVTACERCYFAVVESIQLCAPEAGAEIARAPGPRRWTTLAAAATVGLAAAAAVVLLVQTTVSPRRSAPRDIVVPAGQVLSLEFTESVSSDLAQVGDPVEARITHDVTVGSHVVIPAGTRMIGSVMLAEKGTQREKLPRLVARFRALLLGDGREIPMTTDVLFQNHDAPAVPTGQAQPSRTGRATDRRPVQSLAAQLPKRARAAVALTSPLTIPIDQVLTSTERRPKESAGAAKDQR